MKVSVIIPTFNRAHLIGRALSSVIGQSFRGIEVLIIDDGSTDDTREVVAPFLLDRRVKYIYQSNKGVSSARNLGASLSSFSWIAFLDSDDEWLPNKISKQVEFIRENPEIQFVHTEENWIRNGKKVNKPKQYRKFGGDIFLKCISLCAISPSTALLSKELFKKVGGFDEDFTVCEDFDLWLKITSSQSVGLVDEFLINKYGGHEDQLSTKFIAMDLFRVRALASIVENGVLNEAWKLEVISEIVKKCNILLKGYEKHRNFENYDEVKELIFRFNS